MQPSSDTAVTVMMDTPSCSEAPGLFVVPEDHMSHRHTPKQVRSSNPKQSYQFMSERVYGLDSSVLVHAPMPQKSYQIIELRAAETCAKTE